MAAAEVSCLEVAQRGFDVDEAASGGLDQNTQKYR
jgi:hypothetical protein